MNKRLHVLTKHSPSALVARPECARVRLRYKVVCKPFEDFEERFIYPPGVICGSCTLLVEMEIDFAVRIGSHGICTINVFLFRRDTPWHIVRGRTLLWRRRTPCVSSYRRATTTLESGRSVSSSDVFSKLKTSGEWSKRMNGNPPRLGERR